MLRIIDNDLALGFSSPTYSVRETGRATIRVELTGVNPTPVTVHFAASNGTAQLGLDYNPPTPVSGVLTFPRGGTPGSVRTRTFTIPIRSDSLVEGAETVNLTLSGPAGAPLAAGRDTAVLSILDNDVGGTVQLSKTLFTAAECAALVCNAAFTVSRTGGAASGVTVDFATVDGTAVAGTDYVATSSTITFAAGQMSRVVRIPLVTEPGAEPSKSFSVVLSNPGGGASLGARTTAEIRITDRR